MIQMDFLRLQVYSDKPRLAVSARLVWLDHLRPSPAVRLPLHDDPDETRSIRKSALLGLDDNSNKLHVSSARFIRHDSDKQLGMAPSTYNNSAWLHFRLQRSSAELARALATRSGPVAVALR